MDNLVLFSVARSMDRTLRRAVLREVREDSRHRFRLLFDVGERTATLVVSLMPELPWIGRPAARWEGPAKQPGLFTVHLGRSLAGAVLGSVDKSETDRIVTLRFLDGHRLVVELATHGANLVLVDGQGNSVTFARRPRSAKQRLEAGRPYRPPELPRGAFAPAGRKPEEIDEFLQSVVAGGETPFDALRRRVFGVGSEGADLLLRESASRGTGVGRVLVERLEALRDGLLEPVIEAPEEPLQAASEGRFDRASTRLLPWDPGQPPDQGERFRGRDPAETAGLYHEAVERAALIHARLGGLRAVLKREIRRTRDAERKVAARLESLGEPERYRRWAEALLAGMNHATRRGEVILVPDPYDPDGNEIAVQAEPGMSPQQVAERHFRNHRRALRGLEHSAERGGQLAARRGRLEGLDIAIDGSRETLAAMRELEGAMRKEGIPVALEPPTRKGRAAAGHDLRPRLEGVRMITSCDGLQILVGRSGRHNHRLTFKLSAPDDFWLHARGAPGAHVVIRNDERRPRPPEKTLREAAAIAAWFSDSRRQPFVDVHWTRRKYVRAIRGASPGTVTLKRYETVRVRPGLPESGPGAR